MSKDGCTMEMTQVTLGMKHLPPGNQEPLRRLITGAVAVGCMEEYCAVAAWLNSPLL